MGGQQGLDGIAQQRAKDRRGHGLGLDGAVDVQRAPVRFLARLAWQVVALHLFGGNAQAHEAHCYIRVQVRSQFTFQGHVD